MFLAPLTIIGSVIAFIYGLVVGSFLNVCIYRLPVGESLLTPPSHCPKCNTRLQPHDLFPLFSYLFLRGKCRYCGVRISPRYFIIELTTGLLFTAFWLAYTVQYGTALWSTLGWMLVIAAWIFAAAMLVIFMIDLDTTYVILPVTWTAMAAGLACELLRHWIHHESMPYHLGPLPIPAAVPGMVVGFIVFVGMDWFGRLIFRKPSMGLGDSYIGAAIGAMLGLKAALLSFGIAVLLGAVIGVILMIAGELKRGPAPSDKTVSTPEDEEQQPQGVYMPFGPFLTASAVLMALAPQWVLASFAHLWHWWLGLM